MSRYVPIVVSIAALVVAVLGFLREPPARRERAETASVAEVQQLASEVRMLRAALAQRASFEQRPATSAVDVAAPAAREPAAQASTDTPAPPYVRFEAPRGIAVKAADNGALSVRNDDPALAGKVIVVRGERDDGTSDAVTIVVPPAGT